MDCKHATAMEMFGIETRWWQIIKKKEIVPAGKKKNAVRKRLLSFY